MTGKAYKNILVPFDDSQFSRKAFETAKILAKSFGSRLHIVTVVDISGVVSPGMIRSEDRKAIRQIKESIKTSAKKMVAEKEEECKAEGIPASGWVLDGPVANEILKFAKQRNIELIIIGSRGLSGLSKIMALGSVSRRISEMAPCPVMIVR